MCPQAADHTSPRSPAPLKLSKAMYSPTLYPFSGPPSLPQGPTYWLGGQGTPFWGGLGLQMGHGPWVLDLDGEGRTHSWQASEPRTIVAEERTRRGLSGRVSHCAQRVHQGLRPAWGRGSAHQGVGGSTWNDSLGPGRKHTDKETRSKEVAPRVGSLWEDRLMNCRLPAT